MKVHWFRSLAFKLFVFVGLQVIFTAVVVSWQNLESFKLTLDKQTQEQVALLAEKTALSLGEITREWLLLAHIAGHSVSSNADSTVEKSSDVISAIVKSNKEILAMEMVEQSALTFLPLVFNLTDRKVLKDDNTHLILPSSEIIKEKWQSLHKIYQSNPKEIIVRFNTASNDQLLLIAVPLKLKEKNEVNIWVHMLVQPIRATKQLINANGFYSFLLNTSGDYVLSPESQNGNSLPVPHIKDWASLYNNGDPVRFKSIESENGNNYMISLANVDGFSGVFYLEKLLDDSVSLAPQLKRTIIFSWIIVWLSLATSYFSTSFVTRRLREIIQSTLKIAEGDFSVNIPLKTKDEVGLLSVAVNKLAADLAKNMQLQLLQARQDMELRTAKAVSESLFPKQIEAQPKNICVYGKFYPATECAGDWWWTYSPSPDKQVVIVGDAVGHGASAAIVVAIVYSFMQSLAMVGETFEDPISLLTRLNSILYSSSEGYNTLTMCITVFDFKTGQMIVVNAGHVHPFVVNSSTSVVKSTVDSKIQKFPNVKGIISSGSMLGFSKEVILKEIKQEFKAGDKFVFYTDGLIECKGVNNLALQKKNLYQFAQENSQQLGEQFFNGFSNKIVDYFENTELSDDITLVVAEISREWTKTR